MTFGFEWNPYADQPHNVAPYKSRSSTLRIEGETLVSHPTGAPGSPDEAVGVADAVMEAAPQVLPSPAFTRNS